MVAAASGARSHGTRGEQPEWLKAVVVETLWYHHCSAAAYCPLGGGIQQNVD